MTITTLASPKNTDPVVGTELEDLTLSSYDPINFTLPSDAFRDADGDTLILTAYVEVTKVDPDGNLVVVGSVALPQWLSFDADTWTFSGTPPQDFDDTLTISVWAKDSETDIVADVVQSFDLTITPLNEEPIVGTELEDLTLSSYDPIDFTLPADAFTDADGDALTARAVVSTTTYDPDDNSYLTGEGPLPSWLSFDPDTWTFTGTPPEDFDCTLRIVVYVTDGKPGTSDYISQSFDLTITPLNEEPIIGTELEDLTLSSYDPIDFTLPSDAFTDADGDALTARAVVSTTTYDPDDNSYLTGEGPLPSWLSFDPDTWTFTGTPPEDFDCTLRIVVYVTDGKPGTSDYIGQSFDLTITPINVDPLAGTELQDLTVSSYDPINFTLPSDAFTDDDGDPLVMTAFVQTVHGDPDSGSYVVGEGPLPSWLSLDPDTWTFTGTPPADFDGTLQIVVYVTDNKPDSAVDASQQFNLIITPINDDPVAGTELADQSLYASDPINFTLPSDAFTDADGDAITVRAVVETVHGDPDSGSYVVGEGPLPSWLSLDPDTWTFTGTPPRDFDGTLRIVVYASNGKPDSSDDVGQTFKLTIGPNLAAIQAAFEEIYEDSSSDGAGNEGSNNGVLVTDDQLALVADDVFLFSDNNGNSALEARYQTAIQAETGFSNLPTEEEVQAIIDEENKDLSSLFQRATGFNDSYVTTWDVSGVANMSSMFRTTNAFNQNIGSWDVSGVTNMSSMLRRATAFDQDLGNWDISSLTSAGNMLTGSGMSQDNFDKLLAGWATLDTVAGEAAIQSGVNLGASGLTYTDATSKNHLEQAYGWTVGGTQSATGANGETVTVGSNSGETVDRSSTTDAQIIHALDGDDTVLGGSGNDILVGGAGDDTLTGGDGVNSFVYKFDRAGHDTITDFDLNNDVIDVGQLIIGEDQVGFTLSDHVWVEESSDGKVTLVIDRDGTGAGTTLVRITLASIDYASINPNTFVSDLVDGKLVFDTSVDSAEQLALQEIYEDSSSDGAGNEGSNNGVLVTDDQLALVADDVFHFSDNNGNSALEARYQAAIQAETGFSNLPTEAEVQAIIDAENKDLSSLFAGEVIYDYDNNIITYI